MPKKKILKVAKWDGMAPCGVHGADYPEQPCTLAHESGSTTFGLKATRINSSASAPCSGWYHLVEHTAEDSTRQLNPPSMFDILGRVLGPLPEIGSEFEVTVSVKVIKSAKASTKKCHNPWPAHRCRS